MDLVRKYWLVAAAFIVGLIIGLFFAWMVWPVEWTDATPAQLSEEYQEMWVEMTAQLYSFTNDTEMVQTALGGWGGDVVACELAATTPAADEKARLEAVAGVINGVGCSGVPVESAPEEESGGGSTLLLVLGLLFALALLVLLIFWVLSRRAATTQPVRQEPSTSIEDVPDQTQTAVTPAEDDVATVPIARFHTTYSRGHDAFDESFSIENKNAEFLGECGVGIAESLGTDLPKSVTALEIWLFDKSDIRTITKVVMSDHAYFDDALKAKLAPKGEPVLARESETIVLETASLIINAEITEMAYTADTQQPAKSSFDRITISLNVWSKEGAQPQPIETDLDDMIDF
jgi:hypothetical protein